MNVKQSKSLIKRPPYFDDALITSIVRYREADCIVRLFTRSGGRTSAFYRRGLSIRKGTGAVFAPSLAKVGLVDSSHKLLRMVSCDIVPRALVFSQSLRSFGYSAYLCELIEKFLPEADPAPEIFLMIEDALFSLEKNTASASLLRSFEVKLLEYCGYLPELPQGTEEQAVRAFDPVSCRFTSDISESSFPFSSMALLLLKSMLIAKVGSVNYEESGELLMIGRVFQSRLKLLGLSPLKSVAFLKQLSGR